eukprot:CAMPEP_0172451932 /NCGR_PEP_ID=MMETSP1065-20121228/9747_1 /TAXON_ID=265537 /ORGANISM="Amphiprora paludosa, Strain CCMP125" /LENGTH=448 /DNA_ID=CAMNT_0013203903 /DNA_START=29 /DNA_END=1375 /DNA_ORIENTATION=-
MPKKSIQVTLLQMKGIFTLSLFLLAESVLLTSAAAAATTESNNHHRHNHQNQDNGFRNPFRSTSAATTATESCDAAGETCSITTTAPLLSRLWPRGGNHQKNKLDSPYCIKCVDQCALDIPRGGHSHSHASHGPEDVVSAAATAAGVTPYGIPLHMWKVIFQAILTTINVLCWLIPLRSKQISENQLALSLANAFSGGVFLSLAFVHLIPECTHGFGPEWPEAAPFGLILVGYLLIFFVEKVAFDAHDILHEMQAGPGGHSGHAHHHHHHDHGDKAKAVIKNGSSSMTSDASTESSHTGRSAVILLGALGVHSVLEMMALGLSDSFGDSALLTMSIALHQPAESIALLVAFLKSGMPKNQILQYLSIFSCMGPIGVALGMAVNEYAAPIVDSIFLAIVAGTFVYVGATEVIPEEWEDSSYKWTKFGALMTGIAMIVVITQYTHAMGGH